MNRLHVGYPNVCKFSIGDTVMDQPENGWRGVVALSYKDGWIDVDTRYRWTRDEIMAISSVAMRLWRRLVH